MSSYSVILDCGSLTSKVGFAGDSCPQEVFETVVGRSNVGGMISVAEDALTKQKFLTLRHPIEQGQITNWDDMERIWEYGLLTANAPLESIRLLLTECYTHELKKRERITEILFEKFNLNSIYLGLQPVLALYGEGYANGCVLESGYDVTYAMCVINGYAIKNTIVKSIICGKEISNGLNRSLIESGTLIRNNSSDSLHRGDVSGTLEDRRIAYLKENGLYISKQFNEEVKAATTNPDLFQKSFTLPDGHNVVIGKERFTIAEAVMQPSLIGLEALGFKDCIQQSLRNYENQKQTISTIVLSGGNTMFSQLRERLKKDLDSTGREFNIIAKRNRLHGAWIGGSVIASLSSFDAMWLLSSDYAEHGAKIIHQQCPYFM
jgi:actin-related protein